MNKKKLDFYFIDCFSLLVCYEREREREKEIVSFNKKRFLKTIERCYDIYKSKKETLEENEAQTKYLLIETIIDGLGYSKTDVIKEFSCPNYKQGKIDYIIKNEGKIVLAIEAKAVGKNLDEYREQIDDYSRSPELDDAKVAILTNGYEWRIFIREKKGEQSHFNFDKPSKFILTERPTYDTICNFHKGFSIENILTQAQTKQFKKKIKNYFNIIFDEDSENCEYIRKIFNSIRDGDADFLKGIVINKNVVNSRRDNFIEAFEEFLVERAEKEKKQKKLEKQKEEELKKNEQQKDEEKTETTTHNPPKTVEEFE